MIIFQRNYSSQEDFNKPLNEYMGVAEAWSDHVSKSFDVGNFICDFQCERKEVHQHVKMLGWDQKEQKFIHVVDFFAFVDPMLVNYAPKVSTN